MMISRDVTEGLKQGVLVGAAILVGVIGATISSVTGSPVVQRFLDYFVGTVLT